MVYKVFMQRLDPYSHNLLFEIFDFDKKLVAQIKKDKKNSTRLYYDNSVYDFPFAIKAVEKPIYSFDYFIPSTKTSKLGYQIMKDDDVIAEYYGEVAVVEKRSVFSKKIGFEIYKYSGHVYIMMKVGLPEGNSHYYCLIDAQTKQTVGIIERLQANVEELRAKIYLTKKEYIELMLVLLASETVMNVTANAEGQIIDPSAGKYVSVRVEERSFLDKGFIELAKQE